MALSVAERLVIPLVGAGALLLKGRAEGHGQGFQIYVRYMGLLLFGVLTLFAWGDWIERLVPGANILFLAFVWACFLVWLIWYRHLR